MTGLGLHPRIQQQESWGGVPTETPSGMSDFLSQLLGVQLSGSS